MKQNNFKNNLEQEKNGLNAKPNFYDALNSFKEIILPRIHNLINPKIKKLIKIDPNSTSFMKSILNSKAQKVNISLLDSKGKTKINEIVTNNFPMLEIMRLAPNQNIINIGLSGIKQINDNLGQEFCDIVINCFKKTLIENIQRDKNDGFINFYRIVKNDYKNLSIVTDSTDPLYTIFREHVKKHELIDFIIWYLKDEISEFSKSLVREKVETDDIKIFSKKQFDELIKNKEIEIGQIIKNSLNFGIGMDKLSKEPTDLQKLDSVRKAEISAKRNLNEEFISIEEYDHDKIISGLKVACEIEKHIIQRFHSRKFKFEGVSYNIVFDDNGTKRLSPEFLRYSRKYPEKIHPRKLAELIQSYYQELTSSLDFIAPVRGRIRQASFTQARELNQQFRNGTIDSNYLTTTFKGGLSKEAFFEGIENKFGTCIHIDIKDMGIDNIYDFHLRAKEIIKLQDDYENNLIPKELLEIRQPTLFLEAGKTVTDKFIEFQKRVNIDYPNAKITFGGDEINIFIPGAKYKHQAKLINNLTLGLGVSGQKARILIRNSHKVKNSKNVYYFLERFSKINKIIEEETEKLLINNNLPLVGTLPNCSISNFSDEIIDQISRESFNFEEFSINFKNKFNPALIFTSKGDKVFSNIYENISAKIVKRPNSSVEIYFYK